MTTARIYTVFEFERATPAGRIHYRRHLVARNSFEDAKATALARDFISNGSCAFMTSQDTAEVCRNEIMTSVHLSRHELDGISREEFKAWVRMFSNPGVIDGARIEPSHALIVGKHFVA